MASESCVQDHSLFQCVYSFGKPPFNCISHVAETRSHSIDTCLVAHSLRGEKKKWEKLRSYEKEWLMNK